MVDADGAVVEGVALPAAVSKGLEAQPVRGAAAGRRLAAWVAPVAMEELEAASTEALAAAAARVASPASRAAEATAGAGLAALVATRVAADNPPVTPRHRHASRSRGMCGDKTH